ncbi:helix-turn-helix domain-containing protein, partial [Polaromonas sp.]|uniref:helix-turn-helix domain-containing protein n=1 Tax=Polaromonas sp. TaxID=1869339 RepID=UPI003565E289
RDRRVDLITRIGVDLSEQSVGTTAIGAALAELQPVWLHRGEHFFNANSAYSCAGAPLFGPDGHCVGMLDLTGVDTVERPELKHLVVQSARSIENALIQSRPHDLLIRLNWSSHSLGDDMDGLVGLDPDGWVLGANPAARQMVPALQAGNPAAVHCSELFAMPYEMLFDAAKSATLGYPQAMDVPLWSGLRLHALPLLRGQAAVPGRLGGRAAPAPALPLKDVETALIHKAVSEARGNVMKAARALGISRATVYRRLGGKAGK